MNRYPPGKGFRSIFQQLRCRTAEKKKPRRQAVAVGQDAQELEKIGAKLDFVKHHQAIQRFEDE